MTYPYFYWDWTMLLMIPGIIVAIWAQSKVNHAYTTYSKMPVMSASPAGRWRRAYYTRTACSTCR